MGIEFINFVKEKMNKERKIAFISAITITLLVHLFAFANVLPTHDSLFAFYYEYDMTISGRWFLSIACGISSYFDIPWFIGLLSTLYIGLTVVLIVDIFKVKNPIVIVLISGIVATFPSISKTFQYSFTADGYLMAMLLATLAVWFSTFEKRKAIHFIFSVITICLSCAIYQSYVSFAMLLMLCYFVYEMIDNVRKTRDIWLYVLKQLGIYSLGLAVYYAVWRICLILKHVEAVDYQGISDMADLGSFFEVSIPFRLFDGTVKSLNMYKKIFFERTLNEGISLYAALNIMFLILGVAIFVVAFVKSGLYKRKVQCLCTLCAVLLLIPCAHIWFYATLNVWYYLLMEQCICIVYVLVLVLCERWLKVSYKNIAALLFVVMIFNNALLSNISYAFMHKSYEYSYANASELVMRIRDIDEEYTKIAFVGAVSDGMVRDMEPSAKEKTYLISSYQYINLLYDHTHASLFLSNTFYFDNDVFADYDDANELSKNEDVINMEVWPAKKSIKVIDNVLVIKLSE